MGIADQSLKIDTDWYKKQQIHPPILRLLGPIPGTDAAKLAECLGLDSTRFIVTAGEHYEADDVTYDTLIDPTARFASIDLLFDITCPRCSGVTKLKDLLEVDEN